MDDLQSAGMLSVNVLFSNSIQVCTPCYAVTAISESGPLLCPKAGSPVHSNQLSFMP